MALRWEQACVKYSWRKGDAFPPSRSWVRIWEGRQERIMNRCSLFLSGERGSMIGYKYNFVEEENTLLYKHCNGEFKPIIVRRVGPSVVCVQKPEITLTRLSDATMLKKVCAEHDPPVWAQVKMFAKTTMLKADGITINQHVLIVLDDDQVAPLSKTWKLKDMAPEAKAKAKAKAAKAKAAKARAKRAAQSVQRVYVKRPSRCQP
ncbi:unnamed protein product [Effrenium voratum]|uniref:Uncharacterized protein n=1 Tax=Effrenium voratum TaxID=2562239 RepID=A0AA36IY75_9DINO|nr:unnamed protein product [Effrenium voratum]CAJ1434737.1 unnamed protein product [Effrenium voratum]